MTGLRPWTLEECVRLIDKAKRDLGIAEFILGQLVRGYTEKANKDE